MIFRIVCTLALAALFWIPGARADDLTREARERFTLAIRLVNQGDLSGALAEFQRVQTIAPSPLVVYNLGLLYAALDRPVQAARALERALAQSERLKPEQLERLQAVLREQRARVGLVALSVNVNEGVVQVDNVEVASLPLAGALEVASGRHVIGVISEGHAPARQELLVAGGVRVEAALHLVPIDARLAHLVVRSNLTGAAVFVDGERVGETPLEASVTVLPGERTVELRRAGYLSTRRPIALQQGATGELALDPAIDPAALATEGGSLELSASESQATASVDGTPPELLRGPLLLPRGPHRLRVERGGFLPVERDVYVPLRETAKVEIVFRPTPETRVDYVAHARRRRNWSWATLGLGVAAFAAGTTLAITQNHALPGARRQLALVNADLEDGGACDFYGGKADPPQEARCKSRLNHASNREHNLETARMTGWIVAGVGAGVIATGLILWLTGPALHKYDDASPQLAAARTWRLTPQLSTQAAGALLSAQFQ